MELTTKDLEKLISLHINDEKYNIYLLTCAKEDYKKSLDLEYQQYINNFKKLPHDKQWEEKIKYIKQKNNLNYDNGMLNWNEIDEKKHIDKYISEKNIELKKSFIDLEFNTISLYKNITYQLVIDNMHLNWDWVCISGHKNITYEMIITNTTIPWEYHGILSNKNIKFDDLIEYVINKKCLNKNNFVNELKLLEETELLTNESPTLITLMMNKGVTINDIKKYNEINWNYNLLSSNCNIPWNFVLENIDENWNFNMLFSRPTNTWKDIKEMGKIIFADFNNENILSNFDKTTIGFISKNQNITWDIINDNLHENWDWDSVLINPNTTMKIINNNPDKPWNKSKLYYNNKITLEELEINNIKLSEFQKYEKIFGFCSDCFDF